MQTIKTRLLQSINTVIPLSDYNEADCIFSQKYNISPVAMVYILLQLTKDFTFSLTDDFVDALEACTFGKLEQLLAQNA